MTTPRRLPYAKLRKRYQRTSRPLLATCWQVRSETLSVFYSSNTFVMKFVLYGPKLVKQLGAERTAMLVALLHPMVEYLFQSGTAVSSTRHASRCSVRVRVSHLRYLIRNGRNRMKPFIVQNTIPLTEES